MSDSQVSTDPRKLKEKLLKQYQEKSLEEMSSGFEIENSSGTCFCFSNQESTEFKFKSSKNLKKEILSDLKLLRGIGKVKEEKLKEAGYENLNDLSDHQAYGSDAQSLCQLVEEENRDKLSEYISQSYYPSHPLNTMCLSMGNLKNMLFMDIETLGLNGVPLILIGVGKISEGKVETYQYLLRTLKEEKAVLESFYSHLDEETVLVTFNGRNFDVPFIKRRMKYHFMEGRFPQDHIDLLYTSRCNWKSELPNCQLQTLEKYLFNMERADDVPGYMVPEFYQTYLKEKNIGPLIPIIEHNRIDVVTLARLLSKIQMTI